MEKKTASICLFSASSIHFELSQVLPSDGKTLPNKHNIRLAISSYQPSSADLMLLKWFYGFVDRTRLDQDKTANHFRTTSIINVIMLDSKIETILGNR